MGFRERHGIGIREEMQIDSLDEGTRNLLYNKSTNFLTLEGINILENLDTFAIKTNISEKLSSDIASILKTKYDVTQSFNLNFIYNIFIKKDWSYVYEVLEAMHKEINGYDSNKKQIKSFVSSINNILGKEKCNYKMGQDGIFIKVCNDTEFESIEQTYSISKDSVKYHFKNAIMGYSKRGVDINYHEVCNEALKSVEALARQFLDDKYKSSDIGGCLEPLRQKYDIPPFIIESMKKVYSVSNYGETSTRHSKPDGVETAIGEPEAYYILITCSSFINYVYKTCSKEQVKK